MGTIDFQTGKEHHSATPSFRSFPVWKVREKFILLEYNQKLNTDFLGYYQKLQFQPINCVSYTTDTNPTGTIGAAPNFLPIAASTSFVSENILSGIEIYPNPTHSILNIEKPDNIKINKIEIYDVTGKLIKTYKKETGTLNIQKFSKGIYLIKLLTKDGVYSKQIIKN